MNYKKIFAVTLAATMVMGSSVVAFAGEATTQPATDSTTGTGKLEGTVDTDVFHVVLPTIEENDTTLAFTLDPEGLISKTSNAAYAGATFDEGTLFFKNSATKYSNTSNALTVQNKSSIDVDVTVTASVEAAGIALTADKTFADDTSASMYLAILAGTDETAISENGATVTAQIGAAPTGAYKYSYDATDGYQYILDDTFTGDFEDYSFQLTGASNAKGDWSAFTEAAPSVELTWTVAAHSDAYVSSTALSVGNESVTLAMPDGVTVSGVVNYKTDGTTVTLVSGTTYTVSGDTLTIKATVVANNPGAYLIVTYSDGHTDKLTIS